MNIFAFSVGLVVVVLTMVYAFLLVIINESKKPRNKVHFYIAKTDGYYMYLLYLGKPIEFSQMGNLYSSLLGAVVLLLIILPIIILIREIFLI